MNKSSIAQSTRNPTTQKESAWSKGPLQSSWTPPHSQSPGSTTHIPTTRSGRPSVPIKDGLIVLRNDGRKGPIIDDVSAPISSSPLALPPTKPVASERSSTMNGKSAPSTRSSPASLYVSELDRTVTESVLYHTFVAVGPIASVQVCRDVVTRRSLGSAYINYFNTADAEKALELLNYSLVKDRTCRIMWSLPDPAQYRTGRANIIIKNIDKDIDSKAVYDTFTGFGNVLSCKITTDEHGRSKGCGLVCYQYAKAAEDAVKWVNGVLLNDQEVYVGYISREQPQSKFDEMEVEFTNPRVENLDPCIVQEEFTELFAQYGIVASALIVTDEEGKSKGIGYVNFKRHEDAQRAAAYLYDLRKLDLHPRKFITSFRS